MHQANKARYRAAQSLSLNIEPSPRTHRSSALRLKASVLALTTVMSATAWAGDGGMGGTTSGGIALGGGAGGTNGSSADGQNAPFTGPAQKGGGGGATDITTGFGGSGGMSVGAANDPTVVAPASTGTAGSQGISVVDHSITGGAGGTAIVAASGANSEGAGGGGVGVTAGVDLVVQSGSTVTGGAGGAALGSLVTQSGGAGGGGGGAGLLSSANVTIQSGAAVVGGAGGATTGSIGGGGGGGVAVILSGPGTVTNSGTLTGGNGGRAGGGGLGQSGVAGSGGEGVWLSGGGTLVNLTDGVITGGTMPTQTQLNAAFPKPAGGVGVVGNNASVVNAGTITGGKNWVVGGSGGGIADAIQFIGGVNSLELQAGSTITGNVVAFSAADTLKLGGATNSSFDVSSIGSTAQYQGFGVFEKTGTSTWTLTGTSTQATPWSINQGTLALDSAISLTNTSFTIDNSGALQLNGSNTNSIVAINAGGMLQGTGTVGATTVHTGGVVSPGTSVGTLNINGAYTQEKGGVYQVAVDPTSSASSRIAVNGAATIQNGAIIDVTKTNSAPYVMGARYTVITATNGVSGTFDVTGDSQLTAFYGLASLSDANGFYLEVKQTQSLGDVATTPNQGAVAGGLESAGTGNAANTAVLNQASNDAARVALNELSGEAFASSQSAMLENGHFARDAVDDRLTDALTCHADGSPSDAATGASPVDATCGTSSGHQTGWARSFGDWGHIAGDSNASRLSTSVGGLFVGADIPVFDTWRAGVLAGYSHGTYEIGSQNASVESDDYHVGLYGGRQWGPLSFHTGATYTWHDISGDRHVSMPGFSDHVSSNYHADTAQVFGELGYRIDLGHASVEPFANIAYVNQHTQGFDESGGADALHVGNQNMNTGFSTLGVRGSTAISFRSTEILVTGSMGWRYAVGDVTPTVSESFAGGSTFDISGIPVGRNEALINVGLGARITRNATIRISYDGQYASGVTNQGVMGTIDIAF